MSKLLIRLKGWLYCKWYSVLRWEQDRLMAKSAKQIRKLTALNNKTAAANARVLAFQQTVIEITTGKIVQ